MVRIRLTRTGLKRQPSYRVVVADKDAKRDGKYIELIGHYNPRTEPLTFDIQEGRALYWLSVGAQPSEAVERLLEKQGTMKRLARLRGGESLEALVAEYEGKPLPAQPVAEEKSTGLMAKVAEVVAEVVEEVKEVAEAVVETVTGSEDAASEESEEAVTEETTEEAASE